MSDRTCTEPECDAYGESRGLCESHYNKARRKGTLPERTQKHRLSDIDLAMRSAVCEICGPTSITVGPPRPRCVVGRSEGRGTLNPKPRGVPGPRLSKAAARRRDRLRSRYGMSPEQFDAMVAAQNGLCAICERALPLGVDHNHETGAVRGLLCSRCNAGVGFLGDSPARLVSASIYLMAYSAVGS